MAEPLPERARLLWGGGDWTPRPAGGVVGRIGYLAHQVEIRPLSPIWIWAVSSHDRRRQVWRLGPTGEADTLAAAILAARDAVGRATSG